MTLNVTYSGVVKFENGDWKEYALWYVGFTALFFAIFLGFKVAMDKIQPDVYKNITDTREKYEFLERCGSSTNHLILLSLITWAFFNVDCDDAWIEDDYCFTYPDKKFVKVLMVSCAYFFWDIIIIRYCISCDPSFDDKMVRQTIYHHVIGLVAILFSIYGGYALPGISCLAMTSELSTIFLNIREMFPRESRGKSKLYNFNFVIFILSFTVFRIMLFPTCIYLAIKDIGLVWDHISGMRQFCIIFMIILFLGIFALNVFWFKIICMITKKNLGLEPMDDED